MADIGGSGLDRSDLMRRHMDTELLSHLETGINHGYGPQGADGDVPEVVEVNGIMDFLNAVFGVTFE